ncbi:MAG: sigma-54 factor interaction protein [Gemmatimonadetes bacterium]|nr:sigma-54 factor interaction protein [Gemmatimonadota bacterium]
MPIDTLLVLELSESFSAVWPRLARECGLRFRSASSPNDFGSAEAGAIGIIAAGGDEQLLESTVRAIGTPPIEIAAVGATGDHRLATEVMRAGASDFFLLARDYDVLRDWVRYERQRVAGRRSARTYAFEGQSYEFRGILGDSEALRAALGQAARIVPHPHVTALITGETGTGKELLARALHENGPRRTGPFVDVNCAAIPENLLEGELFGFERGAFTDATSAKPGLFEIADRGTLFLDEIGHLPLPLQGKLLRALEERTIRRVGGTKSTPVDVRVIAATHVNLARSVRLGEFREDLYYRIAIVPISMPALRARPEDILPLARHFLSRFAAEYGLHGARFTPGAERALRSRSWPGNVRELRNVLERAVLLAHSPVLDAQTLMLEAEHGVPNVIAATLELDATIHRAVCEAVELCGGNKSDAARRLGISRTRLQRLLGRPEDSEAHLESTDG